MPLATACHEVLVPVRSLGGRLGNKGSMAGLRPLAQLDAAAGEVHTGPDGRYRVDVEVTEALVLEFDGYTYHHSPEQKAEDERRRNRLRLAGLTVLVYTWADARREGPRILMEVNCAREILARRPRRAPS